MSDALALVEAAYRLELDEQEWLREIARVTSSFFPAAPAVVALTVHAENSESVRLRDIVCTPDDPAQTEAARSMHGIDDPRIVEIFYSPGVRVGTASETGGEISRQIYGEYAADAGVRDFVGLNGVNLDGHGIVVGVPIPKERGINADERRLWARVAIHLMAGLRLRRALEDPDSHRGDVEAILDPSGDVVHAEKTARQSSAREQLRRRVRAIEEARGTLRDSEPDRALEAWKSLVSGRWSIVDRFDDDGRRFLVARRNDPGGIDPRSLTEREAQVAAYAAAGYTNKLIAYELGITPSTVATLAARALRKLGLETRVELLQFFARLGPSPDAF